jgi:basic membrane protein A
MKKLLSLGMVAVGLGLVLTACGGSNSGSDSSSKSGSDFSAALITNVGGIDDKSFLQSAWEGMEKFGKENGMKKGAGPNTYNYFQSNKEADYTPNINSAVQGKYNLIYGVGFAIKQAITDGAKANPKTNFVMIDDVIPDMKNVVSATFRDQEAAYLAGVASATTSKTGKIGYIGGIESDVLDRFEAGYMAGAKSVNKNIKIERQYVGSFADSAKAKTMAAAMYKAGVDVIYQAAGGSGAGVFAEAIAENKTKNFGADDKVWVVGVDMDQKTEGDYKTKDGKSDNLTLCSTVKKVGAVVEAINKDTMDGKFPGGKHLVYGLKDGGIELAKDSMDDKAVKAVDEAKQQIIDGKVEVPEKPSQVK